MRPNCRLRASFVIHFGFLKIKRMPLMPSKVRVRKTILNSKHTKINCLAQLVSYDQTRLFPGHLAAILDFCSSERFLILAKFILIFRPLTFLLYGKNRQFSGILTAFIKIKKMILWCHLTCKKFTLSNQCTLNLPITKITSKSISGSVNGHFECSQILPISPRKKISVSLCDGFWQSK